MKVFLSSVLLASIVVVSAVGILGVALQSSSSPSAPSRQAINFAGRWQVKFTMGGLEKNLILVAHAKGVASFLLLDTGPDDKPVADPQPAAWSQLTNDRISFSGEAELPIGTCCREMGTLLFKGRFTSSNSISGKLIFITSTTDEESLNGFRTQTGTFTATRLLK